METNSRTNTEDRAWADELASYRMRKATAGVPEQLRALQARWAGLRATSDHVFLSDQAFLTQALVFAATPAGSQQEARAKAAFLVCYVGIDAAQGGHRLIATMIDAALAEEGRRWSGSGSKPA